MTIEKITPENKSNSIFEAFKKYGPKVLVIAGILTGTTSLVIVGIGAIEYAKVLTDSAVAKYKAGKENKPK